MKLTGDDGLLQQLTKRVLESALEGELTDHLGHEPGERAEGGRENYRNGHRSKTVITESGPVEIAVPRDRAGSFEPQLVKKRQRRLGGVDEMVLSLSAKGLTHGEISAHLAEVYGAEISKSTISTITDSVMAGMTDWQNRPLDSVYPVVFGLRRPDRLPERREHGLACVNRPPVPDPAPRLACVRRPAAEPAPRTYHAFAGLQLEDAPSNRGLAGPRDPCNGSNATMPQQPRLGPHQQTPLSFVQVRQQYPEPHSELPEIPLRNRHTRPTRRNPGSDTLIPYGFTY